MPEQAMVEERIDRLEALLGQFIVQTNTSLNRLSREMLAFKDEMLEFKDEMRGFKNEMLAFKNEMRGFKDGVSTFKDGVSTFKDGVSTFKDEMLAFKNGVNVFKDETRRFEERAERENRKMNKRWGELANKMGTLVKDIVAPAVRPVMEKYFGEEIADIAVNVRRHRKAQDLRGEYDVIAASESYVFVVEAKSNSSNEEYLSDFLTNLEKFPKLFPEWADRRLVPVFASLRFEAPMIRLATSRNVYVMAYREWDYMDLLNFDEVRP